MYIVEVRPAKEIGDYLYNWYFPNIYLVDDSGRRNVLVLAQYYLSIQ